jgi:hypothetical protein
MIIFHGTNNNVHEFAEKNIDPTIVPTVGMTFKDVDDAYKSNETPRLRNRTSGRTQCKAGIKLKKYI